MGISYDNTTTIMPYSKRQFELIDQVNVNTDHLEH